MRLARPLFGVETEYALTASDRIDPGGRAAACRELLEAAKCTLKTLPCAGGGVFLENGSKFYIDAGHHPELATAEATTPTELVCAVKANEQILVDLVNHVRQGQGRDLALYRGNVDYSGSGNSWGCHESYLYQSDWDPIARDLISHLATRIVYTGAGGFDNHSSSLSFVISPRALLLKKSVSTDSMRVRGLLHSKDESLAGPGFRRLHLICGESNSSHTAIWLKVGTTALILALIEAGVTFSDCRLADPVRALHRFSRDPELRAIGQLQSRKRRTALQIQRQYLETVEQNLGSPLLPDWAVQVCSVWREVLDGLETPSDPLDTVVDWRFKRSLFDRHSGRDGYDRDHVRNANQVIRDSPHIKLVSFENLRVQLLELDQRYGELGERGIFESLDRDGLVDQQVCDPLLLRNARTNAPRHTRARARSLAVRQLSGTERSPIFCDWHTVVDQQGNRAIDLGNPFQTEIRWRDVR